MLFGKFIKVVFKHFFHGFAKYASRKTLGLQKKAFLQTSSTDAGRVGYRGVDVWSGAELFRFGPIAGSANTGEFLAIVHALALLHGQGKFRTAIYCSNGIALSWVKKKKNNAQIPQTPAFEQMAQLLARADRWLQTHDFQNFVLKWKSDEWGDNPAGAAKAEQ